jgi:hypothetical protein
MSSGDCGWRPRRAAKAGAPSLAKRATLPERTRALSSLRSDTTARWRLSSSGVTSGSTSCWRSRTFTTHSFKSVTALKPVTGHQRRLPCYVVAGGTAMVLF